MPTAPAAAPSEDPLRWNTANIYSGLAGPDYLAAVARLEADLAALEHSFDALHVRRLSTPPN